MIKIDNEFDLWQEVYYTWKHCVITTIWVDRNNIIQYHLWDKDSGNTAWVESWMLEEVTQTVMWFIDNEEKDEPEKKD